MDLIRDPAEWQERCSEARASGRRMVLVPTMGYLHAGHLALLREARRRAGGGVPPGLSLATIFVNPTQFGPGEDLARYPRDLAGDLAKCAEAGVDMVLAPDPPGRMYGPGHETWVEVERTSQGLCGARRPGHFRGVATVVTKLFNLSRPHVAIFGEKDWQQLQVIRAMVRDLDFGIEIVGVPTVREPDGLALSSRNAYLSPDERRGAVVLSRALQDARERARGGERDAAQLVARAARAVEAAGARLDYLEIVDAGSLRRADLVVPGCRMLVAAFFGTTRLIDNVGLP